MPYPMTIPQYGFGPTMPPGMYDTPPSMMNFKEGGMASSAQRVKSQGRGNDSMLVHMAPKEVAGLQALAMAHGGSLTINPQTGLPEADFLESILPTLIGAALTIGSGGVINPYMSSAIVGGIQTARTGDLGQGLLAGLGAYGGANIGAGLGSAGQAEAASTVTAEGAKAGATDAVASSATPPTPTPTPANAAFTPAPPPPPPSPTELAEISASGGAGMNYGTYNDATGSIVTQPRTALYSPTASGTTPSVLENFQQAGRGLKNVFDFSSDGVGEAARTEFGKQAGLGSFSSAIAPALFSPPEEIEAPKEESSNYEGPYTPTQRTLRYPGEEDRRRTSEYTYFTPSNPVPFAEGGLSALARNRKQKTSPRFLVGDGDGMSDDIPAIIGGKQPARLADGEFVIPADVVSHLGNGSSKAGAQKLYEMMDRIRQERTGRKRQAPEIRAEKHVPA